MSPFFDKLAPELRLQIYEDLLQFDCPLRHLDIQLRTPIGLPQAPTTNANVSILFTCKKAYDEALPVFYKLNTINLQHRDVCDAGGMRIDWTGKVLIHKAQLISDTRPMQSPCVACTYSQPCFEKHLRPFVDGSYPRLQSFRVSLKDQRGVLRQSWASTSWPEHLRSRDWTVTYTGVGSFEFRIQNPAGTVRFEYSALVAAWKHYGALVLERTSWRLAPRIDERVMSLWRQEMVWEALQYVSGNRSNALGGMWPASPRPEDYERLTNGLLS